MRLAADSASYIDFIYTLKPDNYLMSFVIKATGMDGKLAASTNYVDISWSQRARQIEKGYTYENRLADLTYKYTGDDVDTFRQVKTTKSPFRNVWTGSLSRISLLLPYSSQNRISKRLRLNRKWRNREAVT